MAKTIRESWKIGSVIVPDVSGKKRAKMLNRLRGDVNVKRHSLTREFESCEGVSIFRSEC